MSINGKISSWVAARQINIWDTGYHKTPRTIRHNLKTIKICITRRRSAFFQTISSSFSNSMSFWCLSYNNTLKPYLLYRVLKISFIVVMYLKNQFKRFSFPNLFLELPLRGEWRKSEVAVIVLILTIAATVYPLNITAL